MATTYTLNTDSYDGRYLQLSCSQVAHQDTNKSTINWTLKVIGGNASYYSTGPTTVKINGEEVYYKARKSYTTQEFPTGPRNATTSGSLEVEHDSTTGEKTVSVSIKTAIYVSMDSAKTVSGTWTLDTIPHRAYIIAAPNFTDEDNPTISYKNPLGNNATQLKACISLDGSRDDISYRDISKTGTSYTFVLTNEERAVLRNATTTSNSRSIKFFVRTVVDGQTYNNALTKTLTIVNAAPTISATVIDTNNITKALTGDNNKLIKYFSNATFNYTCAALKGATITSKRFSNGNLSFEDGTSGTFAQVETPTFEARATDTRGNTTTKKITKTMVEYFYPTVAIQSAEVTPLGVLNFSAKGTYFNASFGAATNTRHVYYRYKSSGDYSSWIEITPTVSGNNWNASASVPDCDYTVAYTLQVKLTDSLASTQKEMKIKIATPVFDWDAESFNFNVIPMYQNNPIVEANFTEKWARFSSGLLVQWGIGSVAANSSGDIISFNRNFTQIQGVFLQNNYTNSRSIILSTSGLTNSQFKANVYDTNTRTTPTVQTYFYWLAIGRG